MATTEKPPYCPHCRNHDELARDATGVWLGCICVPDSAYPGWENDLNELGDTVTEMVPVDTAIATTRADIARADTKAQIASAAILAIALAVAPTLSGLSTAGVVAAIVAGLAGLIGLVAAGVVLWPRTGASTGTTLRPLNTELSDVRRIAAAKFAAIRWAYAATGITITAAIAIFSL